MAKQSAGILVYRQKAGKIEVLLAHPGGPFWAKKDKKAWGLIKGEFADNEDPLEAAKREFKEETSQAAPEGEYIDLDSVKIPSKVIFGWAVEAEFDPTRVRSNTIRLEWPPRSGKTIEFPEVDRVEWFDILSVEPKLHSGQYAFIERLAEHLGIKLDESPSEPPKQASLF